MFEINKYLLQKMGWKTYSSFNGIPLLNTVIYDDEKYIEFFLVDKERTSIFVIRQLTEKEKQKSKNSYKFIIVDYKEIKLSKDTSLYGSTLKKITQKIKPKEIEFNSNIELMNLIIEHESCNPNYQRHFRLNKLLKK